MKNRSDGRTTAAFGGVALALLVLTWSTAPRVFTPDAFADRGQLLFPAFTDPNAAASLEITRFDPRTATLQPFKIQNRNGRWTIPSQHDYPVDAKDRLAQTAAAIIALRKDDVASDNAADYERFVVLDPLDTTLPNLTGRGTRMLVRGAHDETLADVIVGGAVEGHPGFRYIRLANQRRVYVSRTGDLKISTSFSDWIERDLLQVDPDDINAVNLRNYALDRATGRVDPGETLLLLKSKTGEWSLGGAGAQERLDLDAVGRLLEGLATLSIAAVLPKPIGVTATLTQEVSHARISPEDRADLARKGFYLTADGQLVANSGEIVVRTRRGVYYTLRFGDIAPDSETSAMENRYLFIMVDHDPTAADTAGRAAEGQQLAQLLRTRFAPWYYVITSASFSTLRVGRAQLTKHEAAPSR
jgi:hypothetical protein